ncbi:hypothetical protein GCM10022384_23340 [Streptomyces marokkonensis]|uniref:Uncharacterized protein n=1 Tax=Streptomyces marokkonensis TaxID=324855 RepID=A0ABP7PVK3_9ACTN
MNFPARKFTHRSDERNGGGVRERITHHPLPPTPSAARRTSARPAAPDDDLGDNQDMPLGNLCVRLDNFTGTRGVRPVVLEVGWVRTYAPGWHGPRDARHRRVVRAAGTDP